jgi:hypothetical protein
MNLSECRTQCGARIAKLELVVQGNGKDGLQSDVAVIKSKLESVLVFQQEMNMTMKRLVVGAALAAGALGNAVPLIKFAAGWLP